MTGPPGDADSFPERRKPWQFTVRLFFGLALVFSLYYAAATMLEDQLRSVTLAALTWCVLGWLYLRFRAVGPLLVLGVGPLIVGLMASPVLVILTPIFYGHGLEVVCVTILAALVWGIAMSVFVAVVSALEGCIARRWARRRAQTSAHPPNDITWMASRRGFRLGVALVLVHTAILASASVLGALIDHEEVQETAATMIAAIDIPLVILSHGGMVFALTSPDEFHDMDLDYWTMAFLGALFHFGIGWLVGYVAGLIRPPCVDPFGSVEADRDRAPEDQSDPEQASTER